ncbi:MAG: flagellar type III secretion system pore protein FliP [Pirellulaceae bacterium]|nr:flagellar type III secretion system pore protein FliP [Planctomycetales bacterium]
MPNYSQFSIALSVSILLLGALVSGVNADSYASDNLATGVPTPTTTILAPLPGPPELVRTETLQSAIPTMLAVGALSIAPALLLMTTSFVRISVVLGLLRHALGTQVVPSNQVVASLSMFLTVLVMWPIWQKVYVSSLSPEARSRPGVTVESLTHDGLQPVRQFMTDQIQLAGNEEDVWLFCRYLPEDTPTPSQVADVPLPALLPAFMISELKTAFLIGFQLCLPFLVIDLVVSSVTVSAGMMMMPPSMVSLPMKLMLFVLVDGWHLVVEMLLRSFYPGI